MSKAKISKGEANKSLRSRVNFLQLAGACLRSDDDTAAEVAVDSQAQHSDPTKGEAKETPQLQEERSATQRFLTSHMRTASQRSQVRLTQAVKHSFCKRCDIRLEAPSTCSEYVENKSSKGRKPWADVKVVACRACGTQKRFPGGARRQSKKEHRNQAETAGRAVGANMPNDRAA